MIRIKEGSCSDCGNMTRLISKRCQRCYWSHRRDVKQSERESRGAVDTTVKFYTIPKFSKKRRAQNVLYLKKRSTFMEQNKTCKAKLKNCSYWSTDVHHLKGRVGDLLTDENNFIALCRSCHDFIELNPAFAKENNFSFDRL